MVAPLGASHKTLVGMVAPMGESHKTLFGMVAPMGESRKTLVGMVAPMGESHKTLVGMVAPMGKVVKRSLASLCASVSTNVNSNKPLFPKSALNRITKTLRLFPCSIILANKGNKGGCEREQLYYEGGFTK